MCLAPNDPMKCANPGCRNRKYLLNGTNFLPVCSRHCAQIMNMGLWAAYPSAYGVRGDYTLDFFSSFGDVELWEVVHRARWQRFPFGHALYKRGEEGKDFHIIAQGSVEVYREGKRVALLGAGTSVGEMAYLAPNPEMRRHSTDVVVTEPVTTISFQPESMQHLSPDCRHLFDEAFIRVLVRRLHAAHEALAHPRRIM